jgi:hypothetical protein
MKTRSLAASLIVAIVLISGPATSHSQAPGGVDMSAKPKTLPSTSLTLTIDGKATVFSPADLLAMPQKTVSVHNAHANMDETYSGVALADLLAKSGFTAGKPTQTKMLHSYLVAQGADKYRVLYSLTEVEPTEHTGNVIVAVTMNGKPIADDGQFKLVSTEDRKPQRWVRNLAAITLQTVE